MSNRPYTKAQAISWVKDPLQRHALLTEAISQDLSLTQIKARISDIQDSHKVADNQTPSLKQLFDQAYRQGRKSRVWDDPKKTKKLEKLLVELNSLLAEHDD